jgi:two-component system sensor histidine kinase ChvG
MREDDGLTLRWSGRWSLAHRILAINILAIAVLALSVVYLDAFRNRLTKERVRQTKIVAATAAAALETVPEAQRPATLAAIARGTDGRLRLYDAGGRRVLDSWSITGATYALRDPNQQRWTKEVARGLDRGFNFLVGARTLDDFSEPRVDQLAAWPEAKRARAAGKVVHEVRNAPDLTPVFSAAAPSRAGVLLVTDNDRGFTRTVRSQRRGLLVAMTIAVLLSILLSLFLARTIVRPLRRLALDRLGLKF